MYSLEVHEVTKRFEKNVAVDEVSFSLPAGQSLAILGPPESGKTTLLRLIAGVETPDRGLIMINGEDVTRTIAAKRSIGMLFQSNYGLIPHMSAFDNIVMPLQHAPVSKEGMKRRATLTAQTLSISHLLERKIHTLNNGEKLRVALAKVLAKNPALYLFDDPFEQLDTPTRLTARRELVEMQKTMGISCIYTTNDQADAFALADRVAVINEGKIQQIGTRAQLLNAPTRLWVAQWLGFPPMNTVRGYLQGTYQAEGICYRVWAKGFAPLLPVKWSRILEDLHCREISLGIRPEAIIPEWEAREKWKPSFYLLRGEITACEWHQGKTLVQLRFPHAEETFMAIFEISHEQIKIGQMLSVAFDPEQFCLFHPETQELLLSSF
ncbi:MAG TPA: ABC transporter ATP-binding protein, partial [Ktedonobacteraceae bacterium]|nr:ABC transporter ATP-binding protein [Ktedonobacteraceae bacterium]